MDNTEKFCNPSPEEKASFISRCFFLWILPFMRYSQKNDLEIRDVYNAVEADKSKSLADQLEEAWLNEIAACQSEESSSSSTKGPEEIELTRNEIHHKRPSLKKVILKTFYKNYILYGVCLLFQALTLSILQPLALAHYIAHFDVTQETEDGSLMIDKRTSGWVLGSSVVVCSFICTWILHYFFLLCKRVGMRIRLACCSLVYRKLLKLSQNALMKTTAGQLITILSNDAQRFDEASMFFNYTWIMPFQYVVSCYIMYTTIGLSTIVGMSAIIIEALFIQGYLAKKQGNMRAKITKRTEYRVKIMNEIVSGIQVIKMYAWEKPFNKVVELARKIEIKYISKASYIKGISMAIIVFTERLILYLILITYVFSGNSLRSQIVFSIAQLINSIQLFMCVFFPRSLSTYAEAKVTIRKLEDFLTQEENEEVSKGNGNDRSGLIKIQNGHASWLSKSMADTLINVNLSIPPGSMCCIIGSVGSGKSSLLHLLLKELPLKKGSMTVGGRISYASQGSWLFVSSVKKNILFGKSLNEERYKQVVDVCALKKDFEQLPHGDQTLVGEKGISLSGGQRARINLARAVYTEADIYLLDDPLSAVDTHVAKDLFEKCIKGFLKNKTVLLATHQLQFLKLADIIIVVNNGEVEQIGSFSDLSDNILNIIKRAPEEETNKTTDENKKWLNKIESSNKIEVKSSDGNNEVKETQEVMEKGKLALSVYIEYWQAGARPVVLIILLLLFIIAQLACNCCDLWIRYWANMEEIELSVKQLETMTAASISQPLNSTLFQNVNESIFMDEMSESTISEINSADFSNTTFLPIMNTILHLDRTKLYVIIYSSFILGSICLTFARSILFYKISMTASRGLHNKMFSCILKAPMRFFDTNPSGRILNRFSKDIGAVDDFLPAVTLEAAQIFLVMIGIVSIVVYVTPLMIIPTVLLGALFYWFRNIYLASSQDVKRIEGITRAPAFSHVTATLNGITTIRSQKAQQLLADEFDVIQDHHTGPFYLFLVSSEAFGFYLDVISNIFLAFVTLQFLFFKEGSTMSGDVGLAISSSMVLTGMLQLGVRQSAEVASNMTSVERVLQYTKLDNESDLNPTPKKAPRPNWPQYGKIVFKNTFLWYSKNERPVLKNLNMTIEGSEKIGIVGRTGAGKSTMIASLFRLAPIEGTIAIDDVDTATLELEFLRSNISIIPQEPVLFSNTVRYNLDPFGNVTDDNLWRALENVQLKDYISNLDDLVSGGGSNFSVGQRQLICLARAIVRNNKILVMDEATANVDPETDALIQKTIRENFKTCTVLTIAHRLNTIMDSDKVLVMEAGQAVEYAPPHELLQNSEGYFTKMVEQTGKSMEDYLRSIAKETYEKRCS